MIAKTFKQTVDESSFAKSIVSKTKDSALADKKLKDLRKARYNRIAFDEAQKRSVR